MHSYLWLAPINVIQIRVMHHYNWGRWFILFYFHFVSGSLFCSIFTLFLITVRSRGPPIKSRCGRCHWKHVYLQRCRPQLDHMSDPHIPRYWISKYLWFQKFPENTENYENEHQLDPISLLHPTPILKPMKLATIRTNSNDSGGYQPLSYLF